MLRFIKSKFAEALRQELHTDYDTVGEYLSYDIANERQHELLSYDIPAFVVRESTGFLEVYSGQIARHLLFVRKEHAEAAREVIQPIADPEHRHIAPCPKCGSSDVREIEVDSYWVYIVELVFLISHRAIANYWLGPKFRCGNCNRRYRASFRRLSPVESN